MARNRSLQRAINLITYVAGLFSLLCLSSRLAELVLGILFPFLRPSKQMRKKNNNNNINNV